MTAAIYARVSTRDKGQTNDNQLLELREFAGRLGYSIYQEYCDQESGSTAERPSSSNSCSMFTSGDLTWCCFGAWTASAERGWGKRSTTCSASRWPASRSSHSPSNTLTARVCSRTLLLPFSRLLPSRSGCAFPSASRLGRLAAPRSPGAPRLPPPK